MYTTGYVQVHGKSLGGIWLSNMALGTGIGFYGDSGRRLLECENAPPVLANPNPPLLHACQLSKIPLGICKSDYGIRNIPSPAIHSTVFFRVYLCSTMLGWQIMTYLLILIIASDITLATKVNIVMNPTNWQSSVWSRHSPTTVVYAMNGIATTDTRISAPEKWKKMVC